MKSNDNSWSMSVRQVPHLDVRLIHISDATHDYPLHIHEEYCVVMILRGTETHICRGNRYEAFPGDLLLLNAEEAHASKSVGAEYKAIHIRPQTLNQISADAGGRDLKTFYFTDPVVRDPELFRILLDLYSKLEQDASLLEQESEFISAITLLIQRQDSGQPVRPRPSGDRTYVGRIREHIRSHFAENLSLSDLASNFNISPFHLIRVFKDQTGIPPHEYQTQVRIANAQQLIRQGHSISEAALETGFFDQSHLSRNFKRITGMTPGEYSLNSNIVQDAAT